MASLALVYAAWRGWDTWPAVDRHADRRAGAQLARLAAGVNARSALLVSKLDWQLENVLLYSSRYDRRDLAWVRLDDVLPHFPFLVRDNLAESRDLVLTADAAAGVVSAYANEFPLVLDQPPAPGALRGRRAYSSRHAIRVDAAAAASGRPSDSTARTSQGLWLTRGQSLPPRTEAVVRGMGRAWRRGAGLYRSSARPFRQDVLIGGETFTIRMDSWLPEDTFRRGGFAQVLQGREHALIVERGMSMVWLAT